MRLRVCQSSLSAHVTSTKENRTQKARSKRVEIIMTTQQPRHHRCRHDTNKKADSLLTMATAGTETDDDAQAALLLRLQAQFGDLDVANLLPVIDNNTSRDNNDNHPSSVNPDGGTTITTTTTDDGIAKKEAGKRDTDDQGVQSDSDESSVYEPTPEELAQWQQAQYDNNTASKKTDEISSVNDNKNDDMKDSRNEAAASKNNKNIDNSADNNVTEEWIQVDEPPSLGPHKSAFFFGSSSPSATAKEEEKEDRILSALNEQSNGAVGGTWQPLYRSEVDGRSYIGLIHGIINYEGPTVLLVGAVPPQSSNSNDMTIIGFYTQTPWSKSETAYGNERCFLFRIKSNTASSSSSSKEGQQKLVQIFRPLETNLKSGGGGKRTYQFLSSTKGGGTNSRSRRSTSSVPMGLGVGGGASSFPRLHITESLDNCTALPDDKVFESGPLLPEESFVANFGSGIHFDADILEVWAVGGDECIAVALAKQRRAQENAEWQRQRNAKVDKQAFLEDFQSGFIDGGKMFEHREQARGRHDFEVDEDEDGKGTGGYRLPVKRSDSVAEPSRTIPGTGL